MPEPEKIEDVSQEPFPHEFIVDRKPSKPFPDLPTIDRPFYENGRIVGSESRVLVELRMSQIFWAVFWAIFFSGLLLGLIYAVVITLNRPSY